MGAGFYAAVLNRIGDTERAEAIVHAMGDSPRPIWGRTWYHLVCSEIDAAALWYERMIEARELFAPIYANSPCTEYGRAARQLTQAETGRAHEAANSR
jgi:hypothetical protein